MDAASDKRVIDRVEEIDKDFREGLRDRWKGIPSGNERVDDQIWAAQFERKAFEAGSGIVTDLNTRATLYVNLFTFALSLPHVDGGMAALRRYNRIRGKE